jgi:hypothetical protein
MVQDAKGLGLLKFEHAGSGTGPTLSFIQKRNSGFGGLGCCGLDAGIRLFQLGGIYLRKKLLIFVAALAIPVILAASSPRLELSWKNPSYSGRHFTNILVLALNGKAENRA